MRSRFVSALAGVASPLCFVPAGADAGAPDATWAEFFPSGHVRYGVHAAVVFDEDGAGAASPVLIAGGAFTSAGGIGAGRIARWDGHHWSPMGLGLNGVVHALAVFDFDGDGPASPVLVAGGQFTMAGDVAASNIAAWDGSAWSALGGGVTGTGAVVRALGTWDPDGPGSLDAVLVVGGKFDGAGGQPAGGLATWNGSIWLALGTGTTATIRAIAAIEDELWVGGDFDQLDGASIARLARFDGTSWASVGTVLPANGQILALATWDDGGGERLAIGGRFDSIDGTGGLNVTSFDGVSFTALGGGLGASTEQVEVLTAFDPDGSDVTLWAGGTFRSGTNSHLARFEQGSWSAAGHLGVGWVRALAPFDPDEAGPAGRRLWIGGSFDRSETVAPYRYTTRDACEWDGTSLLPLGNGLVLTPWDDGPRAASFDPDGAGPGPAILYVFDSRLYWAGEYPPPNRDVAAWDGTEWIDPGFAVNGPVSLIKVLDLGGGPELFASGDFTEIGGIPATRIARWNGTAWSALGNGINAPALDLTAWDRDGTGPLPPVLVAAGRDLIVAGTVTVDRVAQWDGTAWSDLGGGAFGPYGVVSLGTFDEDGSGPAGPSLFAAKNTRVVCDYDEWLFRHDGFGWAGFGTGYGFFIPELEPFDPDDSGPAPEQLYLPVWRNCQLIENPPAQLLARWNGVGFQDMGFPSDWEPAGVEVCDLDGPGPDHGRLFAFGVTGPYELSGFDGTSWELVATSPQPPGGYAVPFSGLTRHDPDGSGPATPLLVALGNFPSLQDAASGVIVSSGGIGIWGHDSDTGTSVAGGPRVPLVGPPMLAAGRASPTPSRGVTRLEFDLAREGIARAVVYDVRGRQVRRLLEEHLPAGHHTIEWDGVDRAGRLTAAGVYFLRLRAHGETVTRRIVRIE